MPSVSIVIPVLNEVYSLPRLLTALTTQTVQPAEVIVVDGGSSDGTREAVRAWIAAHVDWPVQFLHNPYQHIPHALNLGVEAARSEIIVILGGHSWPQPDFLERCLQALEVTGATMVGGALDVVPAAATTVAQSIALAVSSPLGAGDAAYRLDTATAHEVETVPYACFARSLWVRLGGYDETLLTNEDYEFAVRVRASGGRIWFDPRIRCRYSARATLRELARQYWRYGWWKAQMLKRHPRSLRLRQAVPMAWVLVAGLALLGLALWPALAALWLLPWLVYGAVISAGAVQLSFWRGWKLWPALLAAYVVIHFAWGLGAWAGLILGRRPPD